MPQLITNNFRTFVASTFIDSLNDTANTALYCFIGKPSNWSNENSPPSIVNTFFNQTDTFSEIIALKKITRADAKLCVPRYDWNATESYSQYNDKNPNLYSSRFYVLTYPENQVYLCLDNNKGGQSVNKPTGASVNVIETADGYRWKYLYTLSDSDLLRFLTSSYMPVNIDENISSTAKVGSIESFEIVNGGINHNNNISSLTVTGDGAGFAGSLVINVSNVITGVNITNSGTGYKFAAANVSGPGSNAIIRPIISPINGHGKNVLDDLGAYYVMLNTRLDFAEGAGDFPIVNEYRRIGVIKNPIDSTTNALANAVTLDAAYTMIANIVTGSFLLDETIVGQNSKSNAFVVSANANVVSGNVVIRYILPNTSMLGNVTFAINERVTGSNSSAVARVLSVSSPEYVPYSGKILYVENRNKITRSIEQAENIHIVIEF